MANAQEAIANLTHHQNITDALLNTMGECMAVQQALLHIPPYDGKNMSLKTFLQDVENGLAICPEGIHNAFFKGVVAKLRDTARDAVSGLDINTVDDLKNALKEYFAPKKTYSHYCAEIQGIRMRKDESVIEYYTRIKRIRDSAKASFQDKFTNVQVPHMVTMLEGIALESFKRGLSDDLLYAVSVQEPATLDAAVKIAQRIERDMSGYQDRRGSLNVIDSSPSLNSYTPRQVHFAEDQRRSPSPWRNPSPHRSPSRREEYEAPRRFNSNLQFKDRSPVRGQQPENRRFTTNSNNQYSNPVNNQYRNRNPYPYIPPMPYPYMPPMPYPYQFMPQPYYPTPPQMLPVSTQATPSTNNMEIPKENLNSYDPRRVDASTSEQQYTRPPTVKFISAEDLMKTPSGEEPHH